MRITPPLKCSSLTLILSCKWKEWKLPLEWLICFGISPTHIKILIVLRLYLVCNYDILSTLVLWFGLLFYLGLLLLLFFPHWICSCVVLLFDYLKHLLSASYSSESGAEDRISSGGDREILVQHLLVKEDDLKLLVDLQKRILEGLFSSILLLINKCRFFVYMWENKSIEQTILFTLNNCFLSGEMLPFLYERFCNTSVLNFFWLWYIQERIWATWL